jgi:glycosyltransferase involved in cell wall biosynthesis
MQNTDILLSISIPTYNRALYLERCLNSIREQYESDFQIEILVSDNASTDNTTTVVDKYISLGLPIRYIKNDINKGVCHNIAQCYVKAKGKFVVVFGDDDIFHEKGVRKILEVIKANGEAGIISLTGYAFKDFSTRVLPSKMDESYVLITDAKIFISKIITSPMLITANVINKQFVDEQLLYKLIGTNLGHIAIIYRAIEHSKYNIFINSIIFGYQLANTGGYTYFNVFANNFHKIIEEQNFKYKKSIYDRMLIHFYPDGIDMLNSSNKRGYTDTNFSKLEIFKLFFSLYGNNWLFWVLNVGIFIVPIYRSFFYLSRVFVRIDIFFTNLSCSKFEKRYFQTVNT